MSPIKIAFVFLISIAFVEIAAWTIDLPEYRKYLFENSEKDEDKKENLKDFNKAELFFDNIKPDSLHNKDELDHDNHDEYHANDHGLDSENDVYGGKYAEGYEYMSYMEKKVHGIVHNGSMYLEGLRRALENYGDLLTNCSRTFNDSQPQSNGPWLPQNERPTPSNQSFSFPPFDSELTNQAQNFFANPPAGLTSGIISANTAPLPNSQVPLPNSQNPLPNSQNPLPNSQTLLTNSQNPLPNSQNPLPNAQNPLPNSQTPLPPTQGLDREMCERATQASEHVRRLAQLALWATRELQDRAYADKYGEHGHHAHTDDEEEAEAELLLRLAFFLDKLALLTGFEPRPADYTTPTPLTTTPTTLGTRPPISAMGDVPPDVNRAMMDCLRSNSSEAVSDRCRHPLPYPGFIRGLFNITDSPDLVQPISSDSTPPRLQRDLTADSSDNIADRQKTHRQKRAIISGQTENHLTDTSYENVKISGYKDLAIALETTLSPVEAIFNVNLPEKQETRLKRSLGNNPLEKVVNYYVKYKVWSNSNAPSEIDKDFDVGNHLTTDMSPVKSVQKRSVVSKKAPHLRAPENPFQDISNFIKHKDGVHYDKDEKDSEKLREYLQKVRQSDSLTSKAFFEKLLKVQRRSRQKRSVKYEKKFLSNPSEDPRQDISFYVKNKLGTDYNNDVVQAAQVRAGLEQAYQTGNILVVQRYGSNYNPAIPNPLAFGVFRSFFLDI